MTVFKVRPMRVRYGRGRRQPAAGSPPKEDLRRKSKLSESTWVVAILGAVLGVIGTFIGTTVSDSYSQAQYWREQRMHAYVDYGTCLVQADNALHALNDEVTQAALREEKMDDGRLDAMRARILRAITDLDDSVAPVQTIGVSTLQHVTDVTYNTQSSRLSVAVLLIDHRLRNVKVNLTLQEDFVNALNNAYETQAKIAPDGPKGYPFEFTYAVRDLLELGP